MPASEQSNGRAHLTDEEQGVLSQLPRTRPQRATRRRIAARAQHQASASQAGVADAPAAAADGAAQAATAPAPDQGTPTRPKRSTRGKARPAGAARAGAGAGAAGTQRKRASTPRRARATLERAPRQGFESESERPSGPVQPPGGAELMASAAEIVGEIAKAGISAGERLLKDALARLPLS